MIRVICLINMRKKKKNYIANNEAESEKWINNELKKLGINL